MTTQKIGRGAEQIALRLPPGYRDALRDLAAKHGRSVNSEIIAALTWHISRHTADREETRRDLLGIVQQFIDIVDFERDARAETKHLSGEKSRPD